jgi:hypothetical protein
LSSLILFWLGFIKNQFVLNSFSKVIDSSNELRQEDNFGRFARMQSQVANSTRS